MEPFIGQLMLFGGNFAPVGWLACEGQELPIDQYITLYTLIGTTYGGDGYQTFCLPDLRGSVPVHMGAGPKRSPAYFGQKIGAETNTLLVTNLPPHKHDATVVFKPGANSGDSKASDSPVGNYLSSTPGIPTYATTMNAQTGGTAVAVTVQPVGGGSPYNIVQPTMAMFYCIATAGIFPVQG